jgi:hypothetical protein
MDLVHLSGGLLVKISVSNIISNFLNIILCIEITLGFFIHHPHRVSKNIFDENLQIKNLFN